MEIAGSRAGAGFAPRLRVPGVPKVALVVAPVVVLAGLVSLLAALNLEQIDPPLLAGAGFLLVAAAAAEAFPVPIVGVTAGGTSLATIFIVGAAVVYSWHVAALIGLLAMLVVEAWRRTGLLRVLYNASLYVLGGAAAGMVAAHAPGVHTLVVFAAAGAFYATDIVLLAAVVSIASGDSYPHVLRSYATSTLPPFIVMASTTSVLAELWFSSPFAALLLLPPLVTVASYQRSLHRAMERQRELDRLKEEFIAVVSHELRTPLATVYGGVETLRRPELRPEVRESLFTAIRQEAGRLAKLVDDVLWASRLDAQRTGGKVDAVDPVSVIDDVVAAARALAPDAEIVIEPEQTSLPRIAVRREHVERVVTNLVENALKYSPEGGAVRVSAVRVADRVRFSVKDEGIGVPESECERVFDKFTRLDPDMTRGVGGTGLGLYICRELIRQCGGDIWCRPNVDRGTTFTFDIPVTA
jgi:signal transduction histidine kinase